MLRPVCRGSKIVEKALTRSIGFCRCFLLYPMADAGQNDGSAKVGAGQPRICIKICSGNERANGVALAGDEVRGLSHGLSGELCHIVEVNILRPIAIEGATKAAN